MYTRGGKMNGTNEEELQKMGVFSSAVLIVAQNWHSVAPTAKIFVNCL